MKFWFRMKGNTAANLFCPGIVVLLESQLVNSFAVLTRCFDNYRILISGLLK